MKYFFALLSEFSPPERGRERERESERLLSCYTLLFIRFEKFDFHKHSETV